MLPFAMLLVASQIMPTSAADAWRDAWIQGGTARIERACRLEIESTEPLPVRQARWRARFLEMMGLSPLPERTPLSPVITGTTQTSRFRVEKIHFQSRPGLYVTANLYLPAQGQGPFPAVLYVCGHSTLVREEKGADGKTTRVAYGSKVPYQHHPAQFAENGYACLIIDTLQLGEIEGTHHGTYSQKRWWWHDRGYTPAGVELWNAIRALDYLQSRPEVDPARLAVTGRSGGGATSWWLAAADTRVRAAVPVAGLSDLRGHIIQGEMEPNQRGCITGHCDCMYFHNVAGMDFAQIIALCAPRATLLGNSDQDGIFPVAGYRRPAALARLAFAQAGKPDLLALMETAGGHIDTPELRQGAMGWIDSHAARIPTHSLGNSKPAPLEPPQLRVFDRIPANERNTTVDEWFVPRASHPVPQTAGQADQWLATEPDRLRGELLRTSFAHWPMNHTTPPRLISSQTTGNRLHQAWSIGVEPGLELPVRISSPASPGVMGPVRVRILDEAEWQARASTDTNPALPGESGITVWVTPRGIGPTAWSDTHAGPDGKPRPHMLRRRLALLGATVESGQVFDIIQVLRSLAMIPETTSRPLYLSGQGDMGINALYASLFHPGIEKLDISQPPASHAQGPHYLHVLRWLDIPQAVACSRAKKVTVTTTAAAGHLAWLSQTAKLVGDRAHWSMKSP